MSSAVHNPTRVLIERRIAETNAARGPCGGLSVGRCVCLAAGLLALSYAAFTAIDAEQAKKRLERQLFARGTELEAAHAKIADMQSTRAEGGFYSERKRLNGGGGGGAVPLEAAATAAADAGAGAAPAAAVHESARGVQLQRAALAIRSPTCRAAWLKEQREAPPSSHMAPLPFAGGDLEAPGVMAAALAARAPDRELIFLSVGDTRDHRRMGKDPSLRTISVDFLLNLLANLKRLQIGHYLILTTEKLCGKLQEEHCEYACAWTSLWHTHPGLPRWNLKPGDMFLMWAQQWRYISTSMEMGYRVMRADTDVYFAEDPYAVLRGPLFSHFQMVVQHDFFGAKERPKCDGGRGSVSGRGDTLPSCGTRNPGLALLNIGLVYLRSSPGGGVFAVINGTWARFLARLGEPPYKPKHLNGAVDSQALIDQPFMRSVLNDIAVADGGFSSPKRPNEWAVVPGHARDIYAPGTLCALGERRACERVDAERRRTAFLVQSVRPPPSGERGGGERRAERVALAPDWLFGRGCLTHLRAPLELLKLAHTEAAPDGGRCLSAPTQPGHVPLAPGPAAGLLVATHFVYSMALKRKRAFRAFGWDLGDQRNRTRSEGASCFQRSNRAMLLGHTFFDQTDQTKSVLCSLPAGDEPSCSCCTGLPSIQKLDRSSGGGYRLETTGGSAFNNHGHFKALEGCNDYQMFWD